MAIHIARVLEKRAEDSKNYDHQLIDNGPVYPNIFNNSLNFSIFNQIL